MSWVLAGVRDRCHLAFLGRMTQAASSSSCGYRCDNCPAGIAMPHRAHPDGKDIGGLPLLADLAVTAELKVAST